MTDARDKIHALNQQINELERAQSLMNFRGEYHNIFMQLNALQLQKLVIANPAENPTTLEARWREMEAYRAKWGHNP